MTNIYFQHLDIGIDWPLRDLDLLKKLNLEIKGKKRSHWKLSISDLNNELLDWLDKHNLTVKYSEVFYCAAGSDIFLHSDEIDPKDCCKINWVYDQGHTSMRWAVLKDGKQMKIQNNTIGGTYYTADPGDYEYVAETRIGKPTLINAYYLHDVINPTNHDRWCISIVPKHKNAAGSRLIMHDALEIFKSYFRNDNTVDYQCRFFS